MPVLDLCRDVDHSARCHLDCFLAPLLVVASAADADKHLSAILLRMMYMPVVAAGRLECNIVYRHLLCGNRSEVALSDEELSIRVGLTDREADGVLVSVLFL